MADLAYEIAWWPASDAVSKGLTHELLDSGTAILRTRTSYPIAFGLGVEQPDCYVLVVWDKTETHIEFMHSDQYPSLLASLKPLFAPDGKATMVHTHFNRDPMPAFTAPVTEYVWCAPKDGVSQEEFGTLLKRVTDALEAKAKGDAFAPGYATIEERPGQLLLLIGWSTVEAQKTAITPDVLGAELLADFKNKVTVQSISNAKMEQQ